jgi:hypothetical protein
MAVLRWDAAVMMPRGSADVRGEQLAALETEYHRSVASPRITRLLDRAQANTASLEDWQVANLREMRGNGTSPSRRPLRSSRASLRRLPKPKQNGCMHARPASSKTSLRTWRKWSISYATRLS